MALIRCPICGEKFSDTYRSCPFCEEEEALRQGEQIRRGVSQGGKRVAGHRRQPSLLSPMLILVILILAALVVYLLYGDKLAQTLFGESAGQQVEETVQPEETEDGDITMPEDGETDATQTQPESTEDRYRRGAVILLPCRDAVLAYLAVPGRSSTMSLGRRPITLTASGGTGSTPGAAATTASPPWMKRKGHRHLRRSGT
jgi:hypothetical protein